jgi:hypothetical protein
MWFGSAPNGYWTRSSQRSDARSGRHLGNFPQAFTRLALLNAVMHVVRAEQGLEVGHLPLERELTRQRSQG